jgi:sugar lactone lactonase YvrE
MKDKSTETKFKSVLRIAGQLVAGIACIGALILICSSAAGQNLFVSANDANGGYIYEFTRDGVRSTFASGLSNPQGLAFDGAGNLFVADIDISGIGSIYKFTRSGLRTTFATGLNLPAGLAFDSAGNLFVATAWDSSSGGHVYKFTPDGVRTIFASGMDVAVGLAFDRSGNLFVTAWDSSINLLLRDTEAGLF